MQRFDRITWNPNQMNGQPCVRGMRLTVRRVVEAVALYPNRDDLFRNYPELEPEDVQQALAFAAVNTSAREMQRSSKIPGEISLHVRRAFDPRRLRFFCYATLAETHRTDLSAGIATSASRKLLCPEYKPLFRLHCIKFRNSRIQMIGPRGRRCRRAEQMIGKRRFSYAATCAFRGKSIRLQASLIRRIANDASAAKANQHDRFTFELIFSNESGNGAGVARFHYYCKAAERGDISTSRRQVRRKILHATMVEHQSVAIGNFRNESGPNASSVVFISQYCVDLFFQQQLFS